jgi:hypothetical protein
MKNKLWSAIGGYLAQWVMCRSTTVKVKAPAFTKSFWFSFSNSTSRYKLASFEYNWFWNAVDFIFSGVSTVYGVMEIRVNGVTVLSYNGSSFSTLTAKLNTQLLDLVEIYVKSNGSGNTVWFQWLNVDDTAYLNEKIKISEKIYYPTKIKNISEKEEFTKLGRLDTVPFMNKWGIIGNSDTIWTSPKIYLWENDWFGNYTSQLVDLDTPTYNTLEAFLNWLI